MCHLLLGTGCLFSPCVLMFPGLVLYTPPLFLKPALIPIILIPVFCHHVLLVAKLKNVLKSLVTEGVLSCSRVGGLERFTSQRDKGEASTKVRLHHGPVAYHAAVNPCNYSLQCVEEGMFAPLHCLLFRHKGIMFSFKCLAASFERADNKASCVRHKDGLNDVCHLRIDKNQH